MASYQIIAWKDVPAMVEASDGAETVTRQLIDLWARGVMQERSGSATEVADAVVAELEARFPEFIAQAFNRP